MWVRGLKHELAIACRLSLNVAPHVGAWIETPHESPSSMPALRSHPMWVRGLKPLYCPSGGCKPCVAPHVGAWIETIIVSEHHDIAASHPMWVRGLKLS